MGGLCTTSGAADIPKGGLKHKHDDMTVDRKKELADTFDKIDRNHDGHLTRAEMILTCKKNPEIAGILNIPQRMGDADRCQFEKVFQAMDANDDREVSKEEFIAYFTIHECKKEMEEA